MKRWRKRKCQKRILKRKKPVRKQLRKLMDGLQVLAAHLQMGLLPLNVSVHLMGQRLYTLFLRLVLADMGLASIRADSAIVFAKKELALAFSFTSKILV